MMTKTAAILIALCGLAMAASASAQTANGSLRGTVRDEHDRLRCAMAAAPMVSTGSTKII
jgi:hypothetical protein